MRKLSVVLLVAGLALPAAAQASDESCTFVLHKFAKAIGKEMYTINPGKDGVVVESEFLFTDRGSPVPLKTHYFASPVKSTLKLKGKSSRLSALDDTFTLDKETHQLTHEHDGKAITSRLCVRASNHTLVNSSPRRRRTSWMRWRS